MDSILLTNPKPAPSCSHEVDRNIAPETRDLHLSNENLRSLDNEYSSEGDDWLALAHRRRSRGAQHGIAVVHRRRRSARARPVTTYSARFICTMVTMAFSVHSAMVYSVHLRTRLERSYKPSFGRPSSYVRRSVPSNYINYITIISFSNINTTLTLYNSFYVHTKSSQGLSR